MRSITRIKVSDLLLHVGQSDSITIDGLLISSIQGLSSAGIYCVLVLQSLDPSTILARIDTLSCIIHDISDVSGKPYDREVLINDFTAYFVLDSIQFPDDTDDPIFLIDAKTDTIDVADMFYQAIGLEEPIVKRTPDEALLYRDAAVDDIDAFSGEIGGSIVFRKG